MDLLKDLCYDSHVKLLKDSDFEVYLKSFDSNIDAIELENYAINNQCKVGILVDNGEQPVGAVGDIQDKEVVSGVGDNIQ